MALSRYEYGLAGKELYQGANKEDPEAFLEGASMAGLVGVLRQLGDLAEFAAEVFNCLHEQVITTAARGHGLGMRLQQMEAEFTSVEIPILSQTEHSTFFYDAGLEWHSNLQTEENLIGPHNLPLCLTDSYEECRGPPQLFLLDKFDVAGSGSCLKRYSDPSLLRTPTASALLVTSKLSKRERPKNQGLHTTSKEISGDSHAKLHHLFSLEHVENGHRNSEFHVKLKSSGTSYMEKFLKNSPAMETQVTVCSVPEASLEMESFERLETQEGIPAICLQRSSSVSLDNATNSPACNLGQTQISTNAEQGKSSLLCTDTQRSSPQSKAHKDAVSEIDSAGMGTLELEQSPFSLSCCENSVNLPEDSESLREQQSNEANADEIGLKSSEACEVFEGGRDPETCPQYLSMLTQLTQDASEGGTKKFLTNDVEDDHSQHVFIVETESEISLSALVEDHFSSITNQEIEALEPEDISSETGHSSASSFREDALAKPVLSEKSSYSGQEGPQTMPLVTDDSSEPEVPIPDHENQTGLSNKTSEIMPERDLENISDPQESLLGTQEFLLPEHCIQTQDQWLESPPETGSTSITALSESLPTQDGLLGVQGSPALTCNEKLFPSSLTEIEALHAPHQETFTSLNDHHISESSESMVPFSMSLHETPPPLPPLPPTQWWLGKLVESTEMPSLEGSGNNKFYIHQDEKIPNGAVQASEAQYPSEAGENHKFHVSASAQTTPSEPSKATEEQSPCAVNGTYMEITPKRFKKSFALAETAQGLEADWRTEAMALEWFSQNLREHTNHNPVKLEEGQPQLDHPLEPPGDTELPQTLRNNSSYDQTNFQSSKDSLVIGMDRSMLRKVSERNRTQVGARVDENNSLLEIIRSKSFNLRPAEASVRPNLQVAVPKTNLKVAAILEKANTLRQAMAGSDDDHDSDSWSE